MLVAAIGTCPWSSSSFIDHLESDFPLLDEDRVNSAHEAPRADGIIHPLTSSNSGHAH
jgi:hypothetical protein